MTSPRIRTARPGPGKGCRPTNASGRPSSRPSALHLVLEQLAQRLDQAEVHALRQAADIVVRLDGDARPLERDRFDDVRIERALSEKIGAAESLGLALEDVDEGRPDPLALLLRVGDAGQALEEERPGVNRNQRNIEVASEQLDDLLGLAGAQQAGIDEHAGQLLADRLVQQERGDRAVDPAGQPADHPAARRPARGCAPARSRESAPCSSRRGSRPPGG